jgi:hypothetical protein
MESYIGLSGRWWDYCSHNMEQGIMTEFCFLLNFIGGYLLTNYTQFDNFFCNLDKLISRIPQNTCWQELNINAPLPSQLAVKDLQISLACTTTFTFVCVMFRQKHYHLESMLVDR